MAVPADFDAVIASLKLGWYVAEVRGRNRVDEGAPCPGRVPDIHDGDALLLRSEMSRKQREATGQALLAHLAQQLHVDADPQGGVWTDAISGAAEKLRGAKDDARHDAWNAFAKVIYDFDLAVQEAFAETSETQSAAYQLGRALAESYWALDQAAAAGPKSWSFLLGNERCDEIVRLLGRLGPYIPNAHTGPAISGSVRVWQKVAATNDWRANHDNATRKLSEQTRRWYELLVLGQDPSTFVKPFGVLRNLRSAWRTVRAYGPQLLGVAASLAVLFGALKLANTSWGTGFGTTLGALGVSVSALTAKMKSEAQALTTRLREDAYSELICVSITEVPARHKRDLSGRSHITSSTRRAVTAALRNQTLTTAVSLPSAS